MREGRTLPWDDDPSRSDSLASVIADDLIVCGLVPFPCPSDFGPGNRYRLEEAVHMGRTSLVYRAKDSKLSDQGFHAIVAIKVFRPGKDRSHEALTGRRITHPHVLRILDRGITQDGYAFVVSEYVEGGNLSEKSGPWGAKEAARFMVKLCRGVQAAHAAGVVHCDLKPTNVMLMKDGEPKLADFDLARSESNPSDTARGNIAFMAPEQYEGRENSLAPPADIYALGGLLFWLLTGKTPHGDSASRIQAFHAERAKIPAAKMPSTLQKIIRRAMATEIAERYASAAQMADDLEAWLGNRPIAWMRPATPTVLRLWSMRHPARAIIAAGGILVAGVGLWAWQAMNERDHLRDLEAQVAVGQKAQAAVESIRKMVRTTIKQQIHMLDPRTAADLDQRLLPTLTMIEWLGGSPLVSPTGDIAGTAERIQLLEGAIANAEGEGRASHLDTMLKRFALAELLISANRSAEAGPQLAFLDSWSSWMPDEDSIRVAIRAMRACVDAEDPLAPSSDPKVHAKPLTDLKQELQGKPGMVRVTRLLDRVIARVTSTSSRS